MIDYATLRDGTRAGARAGVYMRSVVRIGSPGEAVYVRDARWTRYRDDGRHRRMTGRGVANAAPENAPIAMVRRVSMIKRDFARKWPRAMAYLEGLER